MSFSFRESRILGRERERDGVDMNLDHLVLAIIPVACREFS